MLKRLKVCLAVAWVGLTVSSAFGVLQYDNSFYSPRNRERPVRKSTTLIILHTTEAPSSSALQKLRDMGECNFCISEAGRVYRVIDHKREAFHAGRSMWNGRSNVDEFSVGIEVCGYHDKPITAAQVRALADLIGEIQYIYKIPDSCVLTHSQVAYGAPNKWQPRSHRGRKRCGMLFATSALRTKLNLTSRPAYDPDVKAGRLVVGDRYLAQVLYGPSSSPPRSGRAIASFESKNANVVSKTRSPWDIARDAYDDPTTLYIFPNGTKKYGNQIANIKSVPVGTQIVVNAPGCNRSEQFQVVGINGRRAQDIAGDEVLSAKTIYVYPDGRYVCGSQLKPDDVLKLPYGTKVLLGYSVGGPVSTSQKAVDICGSRWRSADTFFLISGSLVSGSKVNDGKIPSGAMVFFKT